MSRWTLLLVGLIATLALLAAACGTAEEDAEDTTDTPAEPTATAIVITGSSPTAVPETDDMDDEDDEMMENVSVSGIPLDPDARYGGVLQISYTTHSPSFVPWESAAGHSFEVGHMLNNMLIKPRTWGTEEDFDNQVYFELHPDLATDWEQSENGLAYTFNLRDGVDWSDGVPVTCNDIKWSFDTIRLQQDAGLPTSPRKTHYLAVDSIVCPDDLTVVFNLRWAKPAMIEVIGQPYNVIFPAHIYQTEFLETGALQSFREEPSKATTGAYTLARYVPGEIFVFERNPDYWDQPLPYLDSVEMRFLGPGSSQIPPALRAGRLDIGSTTGYTGGQADTLLAECTEVCQFWDSRVIASSFSPALFINKQREGWMSDQRIHEAFALAVDNQKYITTVRNDWYELNYTVSLIRYDTKAVGILRWGGFMGARGTTDTIIDGTKGSLRLDMGADLAHLKKIGESDWTTLTPDRESPHGVVGEVTHFVDCIRDGKTPLVDGVAGRRAVEVVLATYRSAKERSKVTLPIHD